MTNSMLEAVKMGLWEFPSNSVEYDELEASDATPGEREKLDMLADHLRRSVPILYRDDSFDEDRLSEDGGVEPRPRRKPR